MAIKRFTFEIDDSPDSLAATTLPDGFSGATERDIRERDSTGTPSEKEPAQTTGSSTGTVLPKTIGRTTPDLFVEIVNQPRAMATALMFLPIPFFVGKINSVFDFLYPIIAGILLNTVWFGIPLLAKVLKKKEQ